LFRDRNGAASWRAQTVGAANADDGTRNGDGTYTAARLGDEDRLRWSAPSAWLSAEWDIAHLAATDDEPRRLPCLLLSQADRDGFVQVGAGLASVVESLETHDVLGLTHVVAAHNGTVGLDVYDRDHRDNDAQRDEGGDFEAQARAALMLGLDALLSARFIRVEPSISPRRRGTGCLS